MSPAVSVFQRQLTTARACPPVSAIYALPRRRVRAATTRLNSHRRYATTRAATRSAAAEAAAPTVRQPATRYVCRVTLYAALHEDMPPS